ncbi:MAG: sulfatase-like hydrolase/transferase [Saprospiraceae bacterium]|nr:sulfatase-like hydrolase/transferase [Saprospiraceae bacterium]
MVRYLIKHLILFLAVQPLTAQNLLDHTSPNIVLIVADDLGYGDLSCYGSKKIHTPHLDKLADQGMRLTSFYANGPECTPTRTALLTGRYQQRVGGLECAIGLGNLGRYPEAKTLSDAGRLGLPPSFSVLPSMMNDYGYNTALIGKWHLGEGDAYRPAAHGWDYSIGPMGGGVDYFHHTEPIGEFLGTIMEGNHDFYRNDQPHDRAGYYMTHLITDEAVEYLNNQKPTTPFLLYLPYTSPHQPLQAPDAYEESPITMKTWRNGTEDDYKKMIEDLDDGIGKIMAKLDDKGFADNTIVIFFSDNGPTTVGSTGPYSGNKGHVFEGGIRVPCIIRWPGKIPDGEISAVPYISMDITAGLAKVLGTVPTKGLDGKDLFGHLVSGSKPDERALFWRKKRSATVRSAVRKGDLKYIRDQDTDLFAEYLFDLKEDPGEQSNLADKRPADLKKMQTLLQEWETDVKGERYN